MAISPKALQLRDSIIGAWSLIEYLAHPVDDELNLIPNAPVIKVWGGNGLGTIIYTQNGYMSATLTDRATLTPLKDADANFQWARAADEEVLRVSRPFVTYAGPFEVKEEYNEIRLYHHVDISLHPNWIGKPQIRKASIRKTENGDHLMLEPIHVLTKETGGNLLKFRGILTWKRLPDNIPKL